MKNLEVILTGGHHQLCRPPNAMRETCSMKCGDFFTALVTRRRKKRSNWAGVHIEGRSSGGSSSLQHEGKVTEETGNFITKRKTSRGGRGAKIWEKKSYATIWWEGRTAHVQCLLLIETRRMKMDLGRRKEKGSRNGETTKLKNMKSRRTLSFAQGGDQIRGGPLSITHSRRQRSDKEGPRRRCRRQPTLGPQIGVTKGRQVKNKISSSKKRKKLRKMPRGPSTNSGRKRNSVSTRRFLRWENILWGTVSKGKRTI